MLKVFTIIGFVLDNSNILFSSGIIQIPLFVPEGIVWNRIGAAYRTRYVDAALRVYHETPEGLATQSRKNRIQCPLGARLYYQEALSQPYRFRTRVKHCLNYIAFSLHAGISLGRLFKESGRDTMTAIFLPLGYLIYLSDRLINPQ